VQHKIVSRTGIIERVNDWRKKGETIVFTNGCFDILHPGHVELLIQASALGSKLIVGLNTDNSVKKLKGPDRPFNNEDSRALILASLLYIDAVVLFDEDTPLLLISSITPDILVKGGDYNENEIVGADIVKAHGGKVVIVSLLEGYSTTLLGKKLSKGNS